MAAGTATLRELVTHPPYERIERLAQQLAEGLMREAERAGVAARVNLMGSMLTLFFTETPVRNWAQAQACRRNRFARWANALRQQGMLIPPSPYEALFVSSAHTVAHIDQAVEAAREAFVSSRSG
jgi:glutamate-1-semialdehyde 2,1-aminomutase